MTQYQREYGDISRFQLGPYDMYQVTDPAMIEQVLVDHGEDFSKSEQITIRLSWDAYEAYGWVQFSRVVRHELIHAGSIISMERPITDRLSNSGLNRWRRIVTASSTLSRTIGLSAIPVRVVVYGIAGDRHHRTVHTRCRSLATLEEDSCVADSRWRHIVV